MTDFLEEDSFPKKKIRASKSQNVRKGYIRGYELASHGDQTRMNEDMRYYSVITVTTV